MKVYDGQKEEVVWKRKWGKGGAWRCASKWVRKSQCQKFSFSVSKGSQMLDCTILIIKISFLGDPIDCMGGDISGGEVSIYLSIYSYICIYFSIYLFIYMYSIKLSFAYVCIVYVFM